MMKTALATGAYPEWTDAEYRAVDAANYSLLRALLVNPARAKYELDHPPAPSPAMQFGSAYHMHMLQPDLFDGAYLVKPEGLDGRTKAGKAWKAEHADDPRVLLSAHDARQLADMRGALLAHPGAAALLAEAAMVEAPLVWQDPQTLVWCKAKVDLVTPSAVVDLKTTDDASSEQFAKSVATYGYHLQAAHYQNGVCLVTGDASRDYIIIAQEKRPPYSVAVYILDDEALAQGQERLQLAIENYAVYTKQDRWPAYGDHPQMLELPRWAVR
jgi:exodeoxyribonuclease VIII